MRPEIGSEFHWDPAALHGAGLPSWLPPRRALFATACGAMHALVRLLRPRGRLFFPSYFCTGVAAALAEDVPIGWYRHLPDGEGPRLDTLRARNGDVVLAQNLFGRETGEPWRPWIEAHPGVIVVEDHSHDPFSDWARRSTAAYAVASLRKTLPLPDGGLLWSPLGRRLPDPEGTPSPGSDLKLAAMLLKAAWLDGHPVPHDTFRALQQRGEQALICGAGPPSALTGAALTLMDAEGLRERSIRRARDLTALLPAETPDWRVLAHGAALFRVQLLCRSEQIRDALQQRLARQRIFASVHWRQDRTAFWSGDEEAAALAARMLTLPADHRCTPSDVRRLAAALPVPAAVAGRDRL
ncbi:hypothetical protein Ade02nite_83450 [Paractinoplanes deccanensis]|uniref:DegT/DnrJ/EryC1/StrS aminotransferase family protein n=1 Tax=Paractinoplanes deccanensis TaxID=113561 RepID=A0ABQ3YI68_9ACTN|nr:hypothetical protein [Actinoplanes deccanensis]GID79704.1 hypothetical protein Ade02nite_83450 [Actinoplanes deccanensis]